MELVPCRTFLQRADQQIFFDILRVIGGCIEIYSG